MGITDLRRPTGLAVLAILVAALVTITASGAGPVRTMRLDYVHLGTASTEQFGLDGVALEGEWPGPPDRRVDGSDLGKYLFEILDPVSGRVIYSRGFASIYGEWETTHEARRLSRAFHESLRFPAPDAPVRVSLKKRDARNLFQEVWSVPVDPADPAIDRAPPPAGVAVWRVQDSGPPQAKVDLLLVGDGYTREELPKWHADARRLAEMLFAVSPFREHRSKFNVWAADVVSDESGVSRPSDGVFRRSSLGTTYDAFGSERYVLTFDNRRLREVAMNAPYEFIEVVVNGEKYGGGGIFNLFATVAADHAYTPYVFVHEFAHHFAGLADEYYLSEVAYEPAETRSEPWVRNVTANARNPKWQALLTPDVPLPTPWPKAAFEELQRSLQAERRGIRERRAPESEMEAHFDRERVRSTSLLAAGPYAGVVGAFEGAMYEATGYFRPEADCIMFTRDSVGFCAVCARTIEEVIRMYAD
jgi:hypothetical protein